MTTAKKPGRPPIGGEAYIRLGDDLLARVDTFAAARQCSRAEAIRRLITEALRADTQREDTP